jgi:hypothetical protein
MEPFFQGGFRLIHEFSLLPANVLYYILPLPIAWTLCLLLRMFLAGLQTMFVRSIDGTKTGAIFSGIIFASCGFIGGKVSRLAMQRLATTISIQCFGFNASTDHRWLLPRSHSDAGAGLDSRLQPTSRW